MNIKTTILRALQNKESKETCMRLGPNIRIKKKGTREVHIRPEIVEKGGGGETERWTVKYIDRYQAIDKDRKRERECVCVCLCVCVSVSVREKEREKGGCAPIPLPPQYIGLYATYVPFFLSDKTPSPPPLPLSPSFSSCLYSFPILFLPNISRIEVDICTCLFVIFFGVYRPITLYDLVWIETKIIVDIAIGK